EQLVDLAIQEFDEKARLTKDISAAGVLVLAIGTVVLFAAILIHNAGVIAAHTEEIERQVFLGLPLPFVVGALMHERPKPAALDLLLFAAGCGLFIALLATSTSYVFSAMTLGLLLLASAAARARQMARKKETRLSPGP